MLLSENIACKRVLSIPSGIMEYIENYLRGVAYLYNCSWDTAHHHSCSHKTCILCLSSPSKRLHVSCKWFNSMETNIEAWFLTHVATIVPYLSTNDNTMEHGDVMKWKHFPRYWPFVRGIHRLPGNSVNSPHKGQCRGALIFSLICAWIFAWVNNGEAGDLSRNRVHYDVIVMI